MKSVRLGTATATWGDLITPAKPLVERGNIKYLGSDMLAELTLAIHQRQRARDPNTGYVRDIVPLFNLILKQAYEKGIKTTCNGGGANPEAAGRVTMDIARKQGCFGLKVGVITGDDILPHLDAIRKKGWKFKNMDTGEEDIGRIREKIVAANVYIGAEHVIEAFQGGADVVLAGRMSDNTLFVAPIMHEFGWKFAAPYWERIGAAVVIAHIMECGTCCTGNLSSIWDQIPEPWDIGMPIAEVYEDGSAIITKTPGSGGLVNQWTVKDQLVYEVHDPSNYLMPDGIGNFTKVKVEEVGENQVRVTGATGKARPDTLKVCIGFQDGFIGESWLFVPWPRAWEKSQRLALIMRKRAEVLNLKAEELMIDYIGVNTLAGPASPPPDPDINEIGVRIAAKCATEEEANKVRRISAEAIMCASPAGTGFHTPFPTRPVVSLWPTLVPRSEVVTKLSIQEVKPNG